MNLRYSGNARLWLKGGGGEGGGGILGFYQHSLFTTNWRKQISKFEIFDCMRAASIKTPISCGHIMSTKFWPPPPYSKNTVFRRHRNRSVFFILLILNGLKRMILRKKSSKYLKSFQIHIFSFQNILHMFLLKKTILIADRGLTPHPVCGHVRN